VLSYERLEEGTVTEGLTLPPGAGRPIRTSGLTLKVGADESAKWSVFEAVVAPGFDVGAHFHTEAEEVFYVLEGELDLLAFEPKSTDSNDWRSWESASGATVVRGGPGSLMHVPAGCPHAFANPGTAPARMLFSVAPSGHERYLEELADLITGQGPNPEAIAELRARHDIHQVTALRPAI
jgi:oxalate decarboxylase/phosphoglucose isomerase-like protein (cupin superfamily)